MYEFGAMSPQSRSVVSGAGGYNYGINQQPSQAASIPTTNSVDTSALNIGPSARSPQSSGMSFPSTPAFNLAGASPNVQMPESAAGGIAAGTAAPAMTGEATNVAPARVAVQTPRGTIWATAEQQKNLQTPPVKTQRTPAEQQALLDNIRKNAPALNQARTDWVTGTIQSRKDNPLTYGGGIAVPTNQFGEPIKAWVDMLGKQGRLDNPKTQAQAGASPSTPVGFGSLATQPSNLMANQNPFNSREGFTGSMASNYAPPTLFGFGNRTRLSGANRNSSPMATGVMDAFDSGMAETPSFMMAKSVPNTATGSVASGFVPSVFGAGSSFGFRI